MMMMMTTTMFPVCTTHFVLKISLVFTSIYIHCCVSQNKQPPKQPRLRDTERSIAKPLVYLRAVGVQLWEKPKPKPFQKTLQAHQAKVKVLMYASSLRSLKTHMELKRPIGLQREFVQLCDAQGDFNNK